VTETIESTGNSCRAVVNDTRADRADPAGIPHGKPEVPPLTEEL
jgi:hypothetical protein